MTGFITFRMEKFLPDCDKDVLGHLVLNFGCLFSIEPIINYTCFWLKVSLNFAILRDVNISSERFLELKHCVVNVQ